MQRASDEQGLGRLDRQVKRDSDQATDHADQERKQKQMARLVGEAPAQQALYRHQPRGGATL
jgi:hypothetical protein